MRRLLLLRHAKTERTNMDGDHARKLIARGRDDALNMGQFLLREGLGPDHALVSDATRTQETFALVSQGLGRNTSADIESSLYLAAPAAMLAAIRPVPEKVDTLLLIGHNPGIHQLAYELGQQGPHKLVAALAGNFPTCCLAIIESEARIWHEIHATNCRLSRFMTAKSLRLHQTMDADDDC